MKINLSVDKFLVKIETENGTLEIEFMKPSYKIYLEMVKKIQMAGNESEAGFILLDYLPDLVKRWNLQDENGVAIAPTRENVEAFLTLAMTSLKTKDGENVFAKIVEEFSKFINKDENFTLE